MDNRNQSLNWHLQQLNNSGYILQGSNIVNKTTKQPYRYNICQDKEKNEAHYQKVADICSAICYRLLIETEHLREVILPKLVVDSNSPTSYVLVSADCLNCNTSMVIVIQGGSAANVRPGVWSRRVAVNEDLEKGSQQLLVRQLMQNHFSVLIANPNENHATIKGQKVPIPGNDSTRNHILYIWDNLVRDSAATKIAIVAHSEGGNTATYLVEQRLQEIKQKVFAIAFIDSEHDDKKLSSGVEEFYSERAKNWVQSDKPQDYIYDESQPCGAVKISSGVNKHSETPYYSLHLIIKFLVEAQENFYLM